MIADQAAARRERIPDAAGRRPAPAAPGGPEPVPAVTANRTPSWRHAPADAVLAFAGDAARAGQAICALLNGYGGQVVVGAPGSGAEPTRCPAPLPPAAAETLAADLTARLTGRSGLEPPLYLPVQIVASAAGCWLCVTVPRGREFYTYAGQCYVREHDRTLPLTDPQALDALRGRRLFQLAESRLYPYIGLFDLRLDLLPRLRRMAAAVPGGPGADWGSLSDHELLRRARLRLTDRLTGKKGLNLAAVLLLGKEDLLRELLPWHQTDLISGDPPRRRSFFGNVLLMLDDLTAALQSALAAVTPGRSEATRGQYADLIREAVINSLMHRDFTSPVTSTVTVSAQGVTVTNPSAAPVCGPLTPERTGRTAKNPIMESFFMTVGLAALTGSGVGRLFAGARRLCGRNPTLTEGDVFTAMLPLPAPPADQKPQLSSPIQALSPQDPDRSPPPGPRSSTPKSNFIDRLRRLADRAGGNGVPPLPDSDQNEHNGIENQQIKQAVTELFNSIRHDPRLLATGALPHPRDTDPDPGALPPLLRLICAKHPDTPLTTLNASTPPPRPGTPPAADARAAPSKRPASWLPFADPLIELLNIIKLYPDMTNVELARHLGWTTGRIKFYVQKLKQCQAISRVGNARKGYWKVF